MSFSAIPAIDILDGNCVRLKQGDYSEAKIYNPDPVDQARKIAAAGARRLHVVDLDGAKAGKPVNHALIARLVASAREINPRLAIQLGGGLRTLGDIESSKASGISQVILGTAAINDPRFLGDACQAAPGQVLLGLDARSGMLAVNGWTEATSVNADEFARQSAKLGVAGVVYTDIDRDGLLSGPNISATVKLAEALPCPVYASGGISALDELEEMRGTAVAGAIVGRALYAGKISLEQLGEAQLY